MLNPFIFSSVKVLNPSPGSLSVNWIFSVFPRRSLSTSKGCDQASALLYMSFVRPISFITAAGTLSPMFMDDYVSATGLLTSHEL